jgi:hypothetical protein
MPSDIFRQVNFSNGEGLTHGDLNDLQRMLEAKIWDQIIHNQIGVVGTSSTARDPQFGGQDGTNHPSTRAYCLNPGAAYLRQGSANNKIQIAPGTLLQKVGTIDGLDPELLAYTFVGTEEFTLTNGDATNPRVDLLEMRLEYITDTSTSRDFEDAITGVVTTTSVNKARRVQCTLNVKTGTPAASPTIPEPTAGYVPVGSVMVGNGWTTAGNAPIFGVDTVALNNVVVHDQRMPIGLRAYDVDPSLVKIVTAAALGASNEFVSSTVTGANSFYIPCPDYGNVRLVAIAISHADNSIALGATVRLGRSDGIASGWVTRNTLTVTTGTTTSYIDDTIHFFTFEAQHLPNVGPTITQSATTKIGVPLWANGNRCPNEKIRLLAANNVRREFISLQFLNIPLTSTYPRIGRITFFVAEGI